MNILSNLQSVIIKKSKRVGRGIGSGRGSKSGRGGTRHQSAREKIPIHFEGGQNRLVKRFPLLRGKAKNNSHHLKPVTVNLKDLKYFKNNEIVNPKTLFEKNIVEAIYDKKQLKLLSDGEITIALNIDIPVSKNARIKIEKSGGKIIYNV
jgi:large subunit ribosomal protein L15